MVMLSRGIGVALPSSLLVNRVKRRRSLSNSENLFRAMADRAPFMIWMSGLDKRCTFFNKVWLEFTGRTLQEEIGYGWTEGVHPEDLQNCLETNVEAFNSRKPFVKEYRLRCHDLNYR